MAVVHKFRRNVTDLNLNAGAGAGWRTVAWNPKVATPAYGEVPEPVEETLTLLADCSSQDDLATKLQALDAMRVGADEYMRDRIEQYSVWWHAKAYSETGERRALVRKIETEINCPLVTRADWVENNRAVVRATVMREGVWERTEHREMPAATPSAAAAVMYDYTAAGAGVGGSVAAHDIVGDAAARIEWLRIQPYTSSVTLDRIWIGIRSNNKHGSLSRFEPIWECENGENEAIASDDSDSDASGGYRVTGVPTSDDTWEKYFTLELRDVVTDDRYYDENFGHFLWLLRHKLSGSSTYQVQLRFGYLAMSDDDFMQGPIRETTAATAYDYIAMGQAFIPFTHKHRRTFMATTPEGSWAIQVWAKRTSGNANIYFDCFCPIPLDEGYYIAEGLGAGYLAVIGFGESPVGQYYADVTSAGFVVELPAPEAVNFRLPPGDGQMVIVYARSDRNVLTDAISINSNDGGRYYEAWYSLRGSE